MKIILDTNIWISFLIGHKTSLVQRILTDIRFDVIVCRQLVDEIILVANRDKISQRVSRTDLQDLLDIIQAFCIHVKIEKEAPLKAIRDPKDLYLLSLSELWLLCCRTGIHISVDSSENQKQY